MTLADLTTADLRAELRHRHNVLIAARSGTGSTAELERGIKAVQSELHRRERYTNEAIVEEPRLRFGDVGAQELLDLALAHASGGHDDAPREGCPECYRR